MEVCCPLHLLQFHSLLLSGMAGASAAWGLAGWGIVGEWTLRCCLPAPVAAVRSPLSEGGPGAEEDWGAAPCQRHSDGGLPAPALLGSGGGDPGGSLVGGWRGVAWEGNADDGPHRHHHRDQFLPLFRHCPFHLSLSQGCGGGWRGLHQEADGGRGEAAEKGSLHPHRGRKAHPFVGWEGCHVHFPGRYGSHGCSGHAAAGTRRCRMTAYM